MGLNWNELVKVSGRHLEYGSRGHYSAGARLALVATQAANSVLFELRNPDSRVLIIPTRVNVRWIQTGAHTAAIEDSIDLYKATSFSVSSTTNTVAATPSLLRGSGMNASPVALVKQVTVAGAAAGMTGFTKTNDSTPLSQLPMWLLAAQPTASPILFNETDLIAGAEDEHPLVLAQNEGIVLQNRVLLGAAAASSVYIDVSWAEVETYG